MRRLILAAAIIWGDEMPKTSLGLEAFVRSKIGMAYMYGTKGEVVTQARYTQLRRMYGSKILDSDRAKIGRRCVDCSGLIALYTGVSRGSQGYKNAARSIHPISTVTSAPVGALVWKPGHIGIYVGRSQYIAADGSKYNVRIASTPNTFTHWFLCADVSYTSASSSSGSGSSSYSGSIGVGSIVRIKSGAVYGGLCETRGKRVPSSITNKRLTVKSIARGEALLGEISSWVALSYLTKV